MNHTILSLPALRQLEHTAAAAGVDLMQRAASCIADWVLRHYPNDARLLIAAGPGNNGGDALFAACQLMAAGFAVDVLLPQPPSSPDCQQALAAVCEAGGIPLTRLAETHEPPDLIIDGLFGIGLSRDLGEPWCGVIRQLNQLGAPILALDCPSGLNAYTGQPVNVAIRARHTLTFLCHKPGLYTAAGVDLAGEVELATLDCPLAWLPDADGALNTPALAGLARQSDSHKGSYGTVCIVGGAVGMLGAALLAGRAALAGGAGKVFVCTLDDRLAVDPVAPELMLRPLRANTALPEHSVLAVGPGFGQQDDARCWLDALLAQPCPLVLDADALNLLAQDEPRQQQLRDRCAPTILTPHPAEAARLLGTDTATIQRDRVEAARQLAQRYHAIVVLKGAGSLIARPDGFYHLNTTGSPALAVAGQGDVLSGLIAALLAQGLDAFSAASSACYLHGLAGEQYQAEAGGPIGLGAAATVPRLSRLINQHLANTPTA